MRRFPWILLLTFCACSIGCGGSRNDPGMTNPDPPPVTDSISGTVSYNGAPLAGVQITLWITNNNRIVATATTDSQGAYSFSGLSTSGDAPAEYHLWAGKAGYGFYPSVSSGAKVTRADHTGEFTQVQTFDVPIYLAVIDYFALPNASLSGADFLAYDAKTPLVALAATGQTASYAPGDDGALHKGTAWNASRFTDNQDGTVTDLMTGLVWLKMANCIQGDWATAVAAVNALATGSCGLSDGSAAGDWRMPNRREMQSLADRNQNNESNYFDTTFLNRPVRLSGRHLRELHASRVLLDLQHRRPEHRTGVDGLQLRLRCLLVLKDSDQLHPRRPPGALTDKRVYDGVFLIQRKNGLDE